MTDLSSTTTPSAPTVGQQPSSAVEKAEARLAAAQAAGDEPAFEQALTQVTRLSVIADGGPVGCDTEPVTLREDLGPNIAPSGHLRAYMEGNRAEAERLIAKKQRRATCAFQRRVRRRAGSRRRAELQPLSVKRARTCEARSRERSRAAPSRVRGSRRGSSSRSRSPSRSSGDSGDGSGESEPPSRRSIALIEGGA